MPEISKISKMPPMPVGPDESISNTSTVSKIPEDKSEAKAERQTADEAKIEQQTVSETKIEQQTTGEAKAEDTCKNNAVIEIEISHLTKKYGSHIAVDDLSLTIEKGKIYGFLGPNGAGKSTTMNMITGYTGATEGTVKIHGFDIFMQPEEAKKCIGYLPELPPLYTDMTVQEYLTFAAELKKLPRGKRRSFVQEAMQLTKITDVKKRLIRNLSKGYRQRVGFAQAVLGYPQVIILDEPTVGLDPKQIIEVRELIRSLGRQHTVILSSHILSEVKEVCEHIFILAGGRLVASDTTHNLISRMSGEQELRLLLKGEIDAVRHVLQGGGMQLSDDRFSIAQSSESGCCQAILNTVQGEDVREQAFYAFAAAGIPILEMRSGGRSLEEVFLELTNQSGMENEILREHTQSGEEAQSEASLPEKGAEAQLREIKGQEAE